MKYLIENYTPFEMAWRYMMITGPKDDIFGDGTYLPFDDLVKRAMDSAIEMLAYLAPLRSYNASVTIQHFIPKENNPLFEMTVRQMLNEVPTKEKQKWLTLYHQKTLKPTLDQMKRYVDGLPMYPPELDFISDEEAAYYRSIMDSP
jgi:hypothetical protein